MLLAMPTMPDKRFRRAVIYMCRHSEDGALGIIVNQHAGGLTMKKLLRQLNLTNDDISPEHKVQLGRQLVHIGGPVATERGFVLHTDDFIDKRSTLKVAAGICLTATVDVLKAIAGGKGPDRFLLALGYAGWDPGQLDDELQSNGWLHCPAVDDLIFSEDIDTTYERALGSIGVDPGFLVSEAGHA
jgi:putative transcriptional regulator